MISQEYLQEIVKYDPASGEMRWRVNRGPARAGDECGGIGSWGYRTFVIDGRRYAAHRLAFLYMTGKLPNKFVDHVNRNRADNRWGNLREATPQQSLLNRGPRRDNKSGHRYVHWHKPSQRWRVNVTVDGRMRAVGRFLKKEDAIRVADEWALKVGGEYAWNAPQKAAA